ncbi:MAG: DNA polymerase IV [Promethearchaeota archaeon]|nr:MAG: DNA polymerase IV [Candidatus Lokiarchaeota archaeon]
MNRYILHCDLDSFFASVETRDNPEYKDKPVIVGADPKGGKGRGVVSTCSYEARTYGLHSGMPISQAYKRCPYGIYLRPNFNKYHATSKEVMNILSNYSPCFQKIGLDEAYLDITEVCIDLEDISFLIKKLQEEIYQKVGITISVGCAHTKSIAKIASDYNKPNGMCIVHQENFKEFLKDMDITRIPGIGKKSKKHYYKKGIKKIGDIINTPLDKMIKLFGKHGKWAWEIANGLDKREVTTFSNHRKSISKERTFFVDTGNITNVISKIEELNNNIHEKVIRDKIFYKTVTLKIRFEGFITRTRSKTLEYPLQNKNHVMKILLELLDEFRGFDKKVRLVGVKLSNLTRDIKTKQLNILKYA